MKTRAESVYTNKMPGCRAAHPGAVPACVSLVFSNITIKEENVFFNCFKHTFFNCRIRGRHLKDIYDSPQSSGIPERLAVDNRQPA